MTFRVAGSSIPAAVTGFGVVFSDDARMGAASLGKLFTSDGKKPGPRSTPRCAATEAGSRSSGWSSRTRSSPGSSLPAAAAPLGPEENDVSDGGNRDLVVFDDLLFGEPQAF